MNYKKSILLTTAIFALNAAHAEHKDRLEHVQVWAEKKDSRAANYTNPTSVLTPEDLTSVNIATTEDLVKYEPSLIIRRRFIGDSNGTLGMRGSNMFQTSRSMVFADGVPLHYFLQSRWNGAPRWTMVSASEIAQVEVIYGPFSAEYSGNAMGGVVLIETAIPQEQELHLDASYFVQDFDAYGFDDSVSGFKTFASYGDKVGDLSYYISYNHLENESQPQSFYYGGGSSGGGTPVSGAIRSNDERGNSRLFFGDTGIIDSTTDNVKFKLGYDWANWSALLNLAFEDRNSVADSPNSYLRDASGNTVWSGNFSQNGQEFSVPSSRLNVSEQDRESLSIGLRIKGELTEQLRLEANLSQFDILEDETRSSATNPNNPSFNGSGEVLDYDDTGWKTAEIKLIASDILGEGLDIIAGLRHEQYRLNTAVYDSDNYAAGSKTAKTSASGGETQINAAFVQLNWDINSHWNASIGGRYEEFESQNGYFTSDDPATPQLDELAVPGNKESQFSPKFSVGFTPDNPWTLRYSLAKAYRFPIIEELFSQYQAYNAISQSNPDLKPEDGLHHNIMIQRDISGGYLRVNLFAETIKDVIESQATVLPGGSSVRTFVPVDEVEIQGIELIANIMDVLPKLDIRFNATYIDSEIVENAADTSLEGNTFTRMPEWRANLMATYRLNPAWDIGGTVQYASDSFGRLDNTDREDNVFSAQDGYLRFGLKSGYLINDNTHVSVGIDNLTDEIAYVAHPWPGRSLYLNISYDL
ncbi:TonB-dependent receptor [Spongiibacter sp. KMU-158]|uniref:TonB-dependent receptor n=1 Tax=Spongiibacter pelagi TaxID=2760804 RepID=A0A927C1U7_9GAMM|nr:TonB-dependent receptor [Spongiibacter pelagi]MBD2858327.1 TonB-dependent receptor [Spongiibacter pelagi]